MMEWRVLMEGADVGELRSELLVKISRVEKK